MDRETLDELQLALSHTWQLRRAGGDNLIEQPDPLLAVLRERITELLREDMQTLLTAMYRLDIPERKFEQAMALSNTDAIAEALARIVLDREVQRLQTRKQYEQEQKRLDKS